MNLKLPILGCFLAVLFTGCADKPKHPDGPPGGGGGISMGQQMPPQIDPDQMANDLGLSGDQRSKFVSLMQAQGEKMRAIHSNYSLSQKDRHKKTMAQREKLTKEMKKLLTPDQFDQWDAKRQAMRASMQGQGGGAPQGYGPPQGPDVGAPQNYQQPPRYGSPPPQGNEPLPPLPGNS
jgi:hypothetical protein